MTQARIGSVGMAVEMSKRLVVAVGVAVVLGGSIAGCSSSSSSSSTPQPSASGGYSDGTKQAFVGSCTSALVRDGMSETEASAKCGCAYRGLVAKIPFADYAAADAAAAGPSPSPMPTAIAEIMSVCRSDPSAY
ncbi:MAG: hypothetical protein WCI74_08665 [Actinomycetes bacterium]